MGVEVGGDDDVEVEHAGVRLRMSGVVCCKGRILGCWECGW